MRNHSIADRDPCPYRIIEDIGGAFAFGSVGGGVWHFGKGAWQSPKGTRLMGAIGNCAARSPVMGGQFAVWGGLFACCDCSLTAIRQKVSRIHLFVNMMWECIIMHNIMRVAVEMDVKSSTLSPHL